MFLPFWLCSGRFTTQNVTIWHSGNETQQSTNFLLCLGTAQTNSTDSTLKFSSLHNIHISWSSVRFAQKWPVEMSFRMILLHNEHISEPVFYYFYLRKDVKSVCLLFPDSFFTQASILLLTKECVYFCHLCCWYFYLLSNNTWLSYHPQSTSGTL